MVGDTEKIMKNNEVMILGSRIGKTLYQLDITAKIKPNYSMFASSPIADIQTWHERLGHTDMKVVRKMGTSKHILGMAIKPDDRKMPSYCNGCLLGKMHKQPFQRSLSKTTKPGELVHSDVVGPMQVPSPSGARFYILFKDDYTRYKVVFFLKQKSDSAVFQILH